MIINRTLFLKLFRDLWRRRGVLLAVVLVLSVGVSSYISMAGVHRDLERARATYYRQYNLADFTIDVKRAPETVVSNLEKLPNILRLRHRIQTEVMIELPDKSYRAQHRPIAGKALSLPVPRQDIINNIKLHKGRWFSSDYAHEVILDQQFASKRHLVPGDRVMVHLPDQVYDLLVVGTAFSPEFVMVLPPGGSISPEPENYAIMYLPKEFLQQASDLNSTFNQLLGMTRDSSKTALKNTMALVSDKLNPYGVQLQTAQRDQISVKVLHDELKNVKTVITIFPTMFLLVAALVLNVMLNRLVTQQRSVIGILKALGYGNAVLIRHYLYYGIIIGLLGGLLGIGVGIWLQSGMLEMYKVFFVIPGIDLHIYTNVLVNGMIISVVSALIGSIFSAYQAMQLTPVEAIRPPAPEESSHVILEALTRFWKRLSFQNKMVMRTIVRNRFRSLVTISASILATALVLSSLSFIDSIDKMIRFSFDLMQHQDMTLSFREPLGKHIMQTASLLPGVKKVEAQLSIPAELSNGPHMKQLEVTGLPVQHELFSLVNKHGDTIYLARDGLTLTDTLADILHVKVGDTVTLRPLLGRRTPVAVKVKKTFRSYFGLSAYADQSWLSYLLGDSWVANRLLFKWHENADKQAFIGEAKQFYSVINMVEMAVSKALLIFTFDQFLTISILFMVGFAGIIAMGAVINTAMISLSERENDVACLRVLGLTNYQVWKIFFNESLWLNIIGILLGLLLGIYFVYYMSVEFSTEVFRMPMVVSPARLIETVFMMLGFVIISQFFIYRIILKMNWFEVLNMRE